MLAASILHGALAALISITVTADAPADRGLVARRLAEAGHTIVGAGGSRRIHISADAIWMAPDGIQMASGSPPWGSADDFDDSHGIARIPTTARVVPLPDGPARRLVLPHHARALAGASVAASARPVVWLTGRGAVLDRVAARLLDAGFALGWREPVLAVCIGPGSVAVARGRQCGPATASDEPIRDTISRSLRLASPPPADPPALQPPAAVVAPTASAPPIAGPGERPPRSEVARAGQTYALRGAVGIDSRSWVASSLTLERAGTLRWRVGSTFRADASSAVSLGIGLGLGLGPATTLDLTADATWGLGGAGWRVAVPVGFGRQTRLVVEPAWSPRGPAAAILLSWPL